MSAPRPRPAGKSITPTPTRLHAAEPAGPQTTVGEPTGAAEGVVTAVRPDPRRPDGRRPVAWLHIVTPGRGTTPTARSWCACGHDRFASGQRRVLALIADHTAHRDACPLRTNQEGRTAA
ncbi:hypothetical protein [Streptomyces sp. KHY 26]|uniref:hypothetical protein n=1 Tax=Streptomyces sp. KHY 26 TaxID=3097359 RepID=UPI00376F14C0